MHLSFHQNFPIRYRKCSLGNAKIPCITWSPMCRYFSKVSFCSSWKKWKTFIFMFPFVLDNGYWPSNFHYKMANQVTSESKIISRHIPLFTRKWALLVSLSTACFFSSSISFRIAGLIDLGAGVGVTDFIRIDFNFIWDSSSL